MSDREIIWVTINTNSVKEAEKIGRAVLKERLCACFSIIARIKSVYYWPPKSKKFETSKGPLLTLETLPKHYSKITKVVKELHSDKIPFIGQWEMEKVEKNFYNWMKREISSR